MPKKIFLLIFWKVDVDVWRSNIVKAVFLFCRSLQPLKVAHLVQRRRQLKAKVRSMLLTMYVYSLVNFDNFLFRRWTNEQGIEEGFEGDYRQSRPGILHNETSSYNCIWEIPRCQLIKKKSRNKRNGEISACMRKLTCNVTWMFLRENCFLLNLLFLSRRQLLGLHSSLDTANQTAILRTATITYSYNSTLFLASSQLFFLEWISSNVQQTSPSHNVSAVSWSNRVFLLVFATKAH